MLKIDLVPEVLIGNIQNNEMEEFLTLKNYVM